MKNRIHLSILNRLAEYIEYDINHMCTTLYYSCLLIECQKNTLQNKIENLINQNEQNNNEYNYIEQKDILNLLQSLNKYYLDLQQEDLFNDFCCPSKIFVKQDNQYQVQDFSFMTYHHNAYELYRRKFKADEFNIISPLAPEQVSLLRSDKEEYFDNEKLASWFIGINILCAMTLENFQVFYDMNNQIVDFKKIRTCLESVSNYYNNHLIQLIKECLQFNPDTRFSLDNISAYLKMNFNQNLINNFLDFLNKLINIYK